MRCTDAKPLFPLYLDGAVTGVEMHALAEHMSVCAQCCSEYNKLENARQLVAALGRRPAPPDLALKIRVAISHERSHSLGRVLRGYVTRFEEAINAFMLPATVGIVTAVTFFGVLAGFFVPARAESDDVVPAIYSPARLQPPQTAMAASAEMDMNLESPVVIQAWVDSSGKVQNYQIISGPDNAQIRSQLNRALLFTDFFPVHAFGQPVPGKAVISFSHINVKG
ncbi:MAG: zf-HC2 domain-containing protein [Acidobacteriia bacterium]|nr:zf-HC2 domain-containing protein [Terriglobia bacterium]